MSITVNVALSQLELEPDEFIVDPWVREHATLVDEQRGRITAAAHLVRYDDGTSVGRDLRDAGELRWLLQWPDASYWPDTHLAGGPTSIGCSMGSASRAVGVNRCSSPTSQTFPAMPGTI
ncbi:hypothetical protein ACFQE5_09710 [Pseudonocardia hispaniensis]|uniref:Uncharacterized protein n=1 Tax=Pseudonocardia hispaniensis TaxID=904933 RepID=A0ABW1J243_9PSEU